MKDNNQVHRAKPAISNMHPIHIAAFCYSYVDFSDGISMIWLINFFVSLHLFALS